jgi:PAS domain S-box-containing protein
MNDRPNAIPSAGNSSFGGGVRGRVRRVLDRLFGQRAFRGELDDERIARELLHVTLNSIGDAVIVTDESGHVRTLNPEAERLTGWQQRDCLGKPLGDVFHIVNEQSGEAVESPMEKVLRDGSAVLLANHTMLVSKDGTRIPIDDSAAPIRGKSGPLQGVVLVFRDVTQTRAAERAQTRLAAIVHHSADAIVTKNLDGIVQTWNASAEKLFGYRPEEIIGRSITLLLPPERLHEEAEILARLRTGQSSERLETVRVTKGGRRIYVSISVSPLRDRDGAIIGASKIVHDITDRKIAEVAMREREEALREADRRKDEFLAVLSHELRNPLAPITMAATLMGRHPSVDPGQNALRDIITRQTAHLSRLLDDLLDVNRIRSGKIVLRRETVNFADAISRAVESMAPSFESKLQQFDLDLPPQPVYVHGDLTRLAQVAANLLSNASKYTPPNGSISLTLSMNNGAAEMRVRDSGIGIREEQMSRIFDMFAQASSSLERSQGGLGVGLALTRMLVELHGGTVTVESKGPGRGSEFIVRIPAVDAPAEPKSDITVPHEEYLPRFKVLVADDNVDSAVTLGEAIEAMGHEVRIAHDGVATVEAARAFTPQVAFLDIGMPRMNGYEAARKLREHFGEDITLVAVTGWGQESDRKRAREASFDHHLTKPVDLAAIENLLRDVSNCSH